MKKEKVPKFIFDFIKHEKAKGHSLNNEIFHLIHGKESFSPIAKWFKESTYNQKQFKLIWLSHDFISNSKKSQEPIKIIKQLYYIKFLAHDERSYLVVNSNDLGYEGDWRVSDKYARHLYRNTDIQNKHFLSEFTGQQIEENFPQFKEFAVPIK